MKLRKGDIIIIAVVLLLAAGLEIFYLWPKNNGVSADVRQDDATVMNLDLTKDGSYEYDNFLGHYVIEVADGRVRVAYAECPDQVCVRTGWVGNASQSIVCLPGRLMVKVSGKPADYDIMVK